LVIVPALIAAIIAIAIKTTSPLQVLYTYVWVWFLLIWPVESMLGHVWGKVYKNKTSDTGALQELTGLPGELWALAMLVGTIAALVYGGNLLLHHAR
jgi:hypothetical protein